MSHDLYASWATSELAIRLSNMPNECFIDTTNIGEFSIFANRESGRIWPIPDGRISIGLLDNSKFEIAVEMKRTNEGLHGVLTAIGQSQAYIQKGYSGSAIVIPNQYDTYDRPGEYIKEVLNKVNSSVPVGVFSYHPPDSSSPTPFRDKLICHRKIKINLSDNIQAGNFLNSQKTSTQWTHLREGSSEPDTFFRYLQLAKRYSSENIQEPEVTFSQPLINAHNRLNDNGSILKYLSNSVGDSFHDLIWRHFWYKYVFHDDMRILFHKHRTQYSLNDVPLKLLKFDSSGDYKKFWSGKTNSIKNKLIDKLNKGAISEADAYDEFCKNVRNRAHSYRQDINSTLDHIDFIEPDGKPSALGYKYVDACERESNFFKGRPKLIFGNALLNNGNLGTFLHYIHRLSEVKLKVYHDDFLKLKKIGGNTICKPVYTFDKSKYLNYLRDAMANDLKVMNTTTLRGGATRQPFQAELAILRKFDFVGKFRRGLGLEINWPLINEYMNFEV